MATRKVGGRYVSGSYVKEWPGAAELADRFFKKWELEKKETQQGPPKKFPSICFSRKPGVGALEIAVELAKRIGYRVIDREVLEHIAKKAGLGQRTASLFDEKYPGKMTEFLSFLFGEKAFTKSDYTRHLFGAVVSFADLEPTIFVGRGAHLILPREDVLAVRFICGRDNRRERIARLLNIDQKEADNELKRLDSEQREFFSKVYGKKDASPYEFDIVVNRDFLMAPQCAAAVVQEAFKCKYPDAAVEPVADSATA